MKYFTSLFFFFIISGVRAQSVQIKGKIIDQSTGLPLSHINVGFPNSNLKSRSDAEGKYHISINSRVKEVIYSGVGYKKQVRPVVAGEQEINVSMVPQSEELSEVSVVAAKTPKYRNKNNPAVDLIHKVMEHKAENSAKFHKEMVFDQYEKLNMSLSISSEKAKKSKLLKKLPFLLKNSDSLSRPGKRLIPVFMQEKLSRYKYSAQTADSTVVLGEKQSRIDQYIDEDGINEYLEKVYQRADLYDHDIGMGNQRFLSPIAEMAPQFYKYFILDTLKDVSPWQLKVMISPKNKQDVLFMGYLYVSLDGHYAVQKATLSVNNQINLNWVRDLQVTLEYKKDASGHYHLAKSVMGMDLGIFKEGTSVFGERTIMINDFVFGADALQKKIGTNVVVAGKKVTQQTDDFWEKSRHEQLSVTEQMAYNNIDSLKSSKPFQRKMAIASLLLSGYVARGPVEVGPFNSFFSFNPVEGARFRLGARTTEEFSRKLFFDGHAAYGTRDKKWKYSLGTIYSLTDRSIYQFPVRSLTLRHSFETQIPGQELNFLEDDNFLLSFKRGANDKWLYNRKWLAEYLHETEQRISFRLTYKNQVLNPAGGLLFLPQTTILSAPIEKLTTSEFSAELRWAPNEKFYQGKRFRRPINNGHPVFTLRGSLGVKDFLGGDYNYQTLTFNVAKRFFLSQFGFSDVVLEAGAVFGKVPYPLLNIHRANQTYAYQLTSYNLMNFMEFMSDRYASLNLQHSFNGFFLNKVPLIKKLQWREVISFKVLTGSISSGNNPANNPQLYRFPVDKDLNTRSFEIGKVPYIEGSIGVSNVFKFLRVDFVKRFTHLNNPGVTKWGIRAKINVDF